MYLCFVRQWKDRGSNCWISFCLGYQLILIQFRFYYIFRMMTKFILINTYINHEAAVGLSSACILFVSITTVYSLKCANLQMSSLDINNDSDNIFIKCPSANSFYPIFKISWNSLSIKISTLQQI